jgi:cyclopropane fatty-acyl-phospholipid synthase-like methyltransferase
MFEHVGRRNTDRYFEILRGQIRPGGRLLNHAISVPGGFTLGRRSFAHRYVFPDGELADVGDVVLAMERAGFEVRDVESLREHYARTPASLARQPRPQLGPRGGRGRRRSGSDLAIVPRWLRGQLRQR